MEMPMDILNKRLGKIRDNGDIDFDNTAAAIDIDSELQEKFLFFPIAELEDIAEGIEEARGNLYIGQGPGYVSCADDVEVGELFTRAEHYLVMYWEMKKRAEKAEQEAAVLAKRPEPGVYAGNGGDFTVIVPEDRRVLVLMKDDGGTRNYSADYDHYLHKSWKLQRIDLTEGTVAK